MSGKPGKASLREISAGKRGLCIRERGQLVLARSLAQVVVIDDEVAFGVQLQNVPARREN